ncbi:MAG: OmpA family protein [Bacteroidota bacterium]
MKRCYYTMLGLLLSANLMAQQADRIPQPNIVPNPSFEEYSAPPIGWFYKGRHFSQVIKYWNSATAASPDVFGPKVRVPSYWKEKGFGKQVPHSGKTMVGITVYGCKEGKPHCREYVQIQLREPLVEGQGYQAEFWVSQLPQSLQVNNIGMYFSTRPVRSSVDELLDLAPQINADQIVVTPYSGWTRITGEFVAQNAAEYLVIGNFFPDSLTQTRSPLTQTLNYSYYYLDDVQLQKVEPILEVPVLADDLTRIRLEEGQVVRLKNIFFEHDKTELLPRSFIELNKLVQLMGKHPKMVIEIVGHTDSSGDFDYNLVLSQRRAKAVSEYLEGQGVEGTRVQYRGHGSARPIASNGDAEGRQLNRRVEFKIIKK